MTTNSHLHCLFTFAFAIAMGFCITACGGDEEKDNDYLRVSESKINMDEEGGSVTIQIESNTNWNASGADSWVSLNTITGKGNGSLVIKVDKNTTTSSRSSTLAMRAGSAHESIGQSSKERNPYGARMSGVPVRAVRP